MTLTAIATCAALVPAAAQAADPSSTAHTAGRVVASGATWQHAWPGVYFEGRFRGTGVGIVLDDATGDYDISIDGGAPTTLVTPGRVTHRVEGLADREHTVRVVKRSEVPWATSSFGGFVPVNGSVILPAPAARDLQLEFVGDSYTAGYGNTSTSRDCTGEQVTRTTNADLSFGAVTARALGADYQLNAFSGRGMVRNYAGGEQGTSYRTYYDRALPFSTDAWDPPADWRPDAVVVGLGINDFSTALGSNEAWATPAALREAWVTAYHGFLDTLRAQYGPDPYIVVSATPAGTGTDLADLAQRVVSEERAGGDSPRAVLVLRQRRAELRRLPLAPLGRRRQGHCRPAHQLPPSSPPGHRPDADPHADADRHAHAHAHAHAHPPTPSRRRHARRGSPSAARGQAATRRRSTSPPGPRSAGGRRRSRCPGRCPHPALVRPPPRRPARR